MKIESMVYDHLSHVKAEPELTRFFYSDDGPKDRIERLMDKVRGMK